MANLNVHVFVRGAFACESAAGRLLRAGSNIPDGP